MATLDWPTSAAYRPSAIKWGVRTPRSAWQAFYTGQQQSVSHLADRVQLTLFLPPVMSPLQAAEREAFFSEVASAGHWLRAWHFHRLVPQGTMRGLPTVQTAALAGARVLLVQSVAGATLLGGDMLGASGLLLQVGYAGAVANGTGLLTVPLVLPLLTALGAGAAVTWNKPTGVFEMTSREQLFDYSPGRLQAGLAIELSQVLT